MQEHPSISSHWWMTTKHLVKIRRATMTSAMLSPATRRHKTDALSQHTPARPILEPTLKIYSHETPPPKIVGSFVAVSSLDLKSLQMKLARGRLSKVAASSLRRTKVTLSMVSSSSRRVSYHPTALRQPFIDVV